MISLFLYSQKHYSGTQSNLESFSWNSLSLVVNLKVELHNSKIGGNDGFYFWSSPELGCVWTLHFPFAPIQVLLLPFPCQLEPGSWWRRRTRPAPYIPDLCWPHEHPELDLVPPGEELAFRPCGLREEEASRSNRSNWKVKQGHLFFPAERTVRVVREAEAVCLFPLYSIHFGMGSSQHLVTYPPNF